MYLEVSYNYTYWGNSTTRKRVFRKKKHNCKINKYIPHYALNLKQQIEGVNIK